MQWTETSRRMAPGSLVLARDKDDVWRRWGWGWWRRMEVTDGVRVGATGSALRAPLVTADADDDAREIKYFH